MAHVISAPQARTAVNRLVVTELTLGRGNRVTCTVEARAGSVVIHRMTIESQGADCQGVRMDALGDPEVYATNVASASNQIRNAYNSANGGAGSRLNAVEAQLASMGLFPA